jgi:hypothetical protein
MNFLQKTFDIYQQHDNQHNLILMMDNVLSHLKKEVKITNLLILQMLGVKILHKN